MPSLSRIIAAAALAVLAIAPCAALGSSVDAKIGWLADGCLAVPNGAIEPGASVTFLLFDPERAEGDLAWALLVPGTILRKAPPSTSCVAPRVEVNGAEADWTLYEAEIETVHAPPLANGLGLIAIGDNIDLDGNGETDSFGLCRTKEGVRLEVWSDGSARGERLWSALLRHAKKSGSATCDPVELFFAPLAEFDAQVGYLDECLAIKDPTLESGTPISIMASESRYPEIGQRLLTRRMAGTILRKVDSPESCPPLHESRRTVNDSEGYSFYSVALEDGPFMNPDDAVFGIGIVRRHLGKEKFDLDGNGAPDSFTACTSLEGFNIDVWSGVPDTGESLWNGNYYLSYESAEWDCPGMFDESDRTVP